MPFRTRLLPDIQLVQNDHEPRGLAFLHHLEVSFVLDVFFEFQIGSRLKDIALGDDEHMNPMGTRVVLPVFPAGTGGDPGAQEGVLEIEPIVYLDLPKLFCVIEHQRMHVSSWLITPDHA